MELRNLLKILSRYKSFILLMFCSAVVTAVLLTYVLSETYRATTSVLIRPQKSIDLVPKKEEILNFSVNYYTPVDTAAKTYSEILNSREIAEKIVKKLKLDQAAEDEGRERLWPTFKNKAKEIVAKTWIFLRYGRVPEEDLFSRTVERVSSNLFVKPTRETYMFKIEAEAKSAALAASISSSAADAFVEYMNEINEIENDKAKNRCMVKLNKSSIKLEQARMAIVDFKKKNNIVSLGKEKDLKLDRLADLSAKQNNIIIKIKGLEERGKYIINQVNNLKMFTKSSFKISKNPIVYELYSDLQKKEIALAGLREKFTDGHQNIQSLQAEIAEIKEKIKSADPNLESEQILSVDPVYQELQNELSIVHTDLETLKAQKVNLESAIRAENEQIKVVPKNEEELSRLELALKLAEDAHVLLSKEYEELDIASSKNLSDIRVINKAAVSAFPVRPIKIYHAALAGLLSLVGAMGMILLFENANDTLRDLEEVEQKIGLPVMMTVPELESGEKDSWPLIQPVNNLDSNAYHRKGERAYVQYPLQIESSQKSSHHTGLVGDLGVQGICFYTDGELSVDEEIDLIIDTQSDQFGELTIKARVLRSKLTVEGYDYFTVAAKFIDLDLNVKDKLGDLVSSGQAAPVKSNFPQFEEPIRGLRSDLLFFKNQGLSSFLVTSSLTEEGKSTIVANLALSVAMLKRKVLLIDGNLKKPAIHNIFHLSNEVGLAQVLLGTSPPIFQKPVSGLHILPAGQSVTDSSALFDSSRMADFIRNASKDFDFVIVDSAPILVGPDTSQIAPFAAGAILVVRTDRTPITDVLRAKQILEKTKAKILGTVLNRCEKMSGGYYIWS